jgi:hypothetical protein
MTPPILEEIRRVRHEMSAEWGHDPQRIVEYFANLQREFQGQIVNFGAQETALLKELPMNSSEQIQPSPQS